MVSTWMQTLWPIWSISWILWTSTTNARPRTHSTTLPTSLLWCSSQVKCLVPLQTLLWSLWLRSHLAQTLWSTRRRSIWIMMMLTLLISTWLVLVLKRLSSWLMKCPKSQCETTIRIQLDNMRRVRASRVLPTPWSSLWRTRSSGRVSFLSRACRSSRGIVFWSTLKTNLTWSKRKSSMTGGQSSQTRKWPPLISLPSTLAPLRSSMTSRSKRRSSRTALTRSCLRTALLGIRTTKSINGTAQCSLDPRSLKDWAKWVCLSLSPLKETACLLLAISDLREGPTLWCSRWTLSRLHRVSAKE